MTQDPEAMKTVTVNKISDDLVERIATMIEETHPELVNTEQGRVLRIDLSKVEAGSEVSTTETRMQSTHLWTNIATTLSGSISLGLVATAFAPEVPLVTATAALVGLIVSWLAARKIDKEPK